MYFFPHFPLSINSFALFGFIILLGLIGGELAKRSRFLPTISGYILIGFIMGPEVLNIVTHKLIADTRIFIDISLGLILFDLGRHLDFTWLKHDRNLLLMSITESVLTFSFIFGLFLFLKFSFLLSLLAATIAVPTSAAVVTMVAHDLSSEGPVTRRTMMLTSLNNFFALVLFSFLLPMTQFEAHPHIHIGLYSLYRFGGSLLLAFIVFVITKLLSLLTGKNKESQFILFVAIIVLTISLTNVLNLSTMFTLFMFGVAARNLDYKHTLLEVDFSWLARLLVILLFVVMGINLHLAGLLEATFAIAAFVILRFLAKISGICAFAKPSRLSVNQTLAMSLTLTPMADVALGMSNIVSSFNEALSSQLSLIILGVVAVLNLIGPIFTQWGFLKADEIDK